MTGTALQIPETLRKKLARLGLRSQEDLLVHLPLRYEDETRLTALRDAPWDEAVQIETTVISAEVQFRPRRQLVVRTETGDGELWLRFFSFYPNQKAVLAPGARIRCFGEIRGGFFGAEMVHPRFTVVKDDLPLPNTLTPVYPTTAGVGQATLRKLVARALQEASLDETLAAEVLQQHGLPGFAEAVRILHAPPPQVRLADLQTRRQCPLNPLRLDSPMHEQQLAPRLLHGRRAGRTAPRT